MSGGTFIEVDVWPSSTTHSIRRELGQLQCLSISSLLIKGLLLFTSISLLIVSVLYQIGTSITLQSLGSVLSSLVITPITCISLVADSLHFRMKFIKYQSILVLLTVPFWLLGCVILVCELILTGLLLNTIATNDTGLYLYLLIVNHFLEAPAILFSVIFSLVTWRYISRQNSNTDVSWNVDDVITYSPRDY